MGTLEALGGATFDLWIGAIFDEGAMNEFVFEGAARTSLRRTAGPLGERSNPTECRVSLCGMINGGKLHTYECDDDEFSQPFAAACELVR